MHQIKSNYNLVVSIFTGNSGCCICGGTCGCGFDILLFNKPRSSSSTVQIFFGTEFEAFCVPIGVT